MRRILPHILKRPTRQTAIRVGIALAFVLGALWTFHLPYEQELLESAIPADATLVTRHAGLTSRAGKMLTNPILQELLKASNLPTDTVDTPAGRRVLSLLSRLAEREMVVAYTEGLGFHQPGWICAGWLGGYTQWLRLAMWLRPHAVFETIPSGRGRSVWVWHNADGKGRHLSVAVTHGVLIACLSDDPLAVHDVRMHVEYRAIRMIPPPYRHLAAANSDTAPDRIIARWYKRNGDALAYRELQAAIDTCGPQYLSGTLTGSTPLFRGFRPAEKSIVISPAIDRTLKTHSDGAVFMSPSTLFLLLKQIGVRGQVPQALPEGRTHSNGEDSAAFAALLPDTMSGRILGVKAPTLIVGIELSTVQENATLSLMPLVDELNRANNWGLIPRSTFINEQSVIVLDSIHKNIYSDLETAEKPALCIRGNRLLAGTNAEGLTRFLQAAGDIPTDDGTSESIAVQDTFSGWLDLPAANAATRKVMALYSLMLISRNAPDTEAKRAHLERWKPWLEKAALLKECRFSLYAHAEGYTVALKAGPDAAGHPASDQ